MNFIRKVLLISLVVCWKEFFASCLGTAPSNNLLLYKYEGNFYPVYATGSSPHSVQGYPHQPVISPVHLSHQIYHDYQEAEPVPLMAIQVQPLQRLIPRGATGNVGTNDKMPLLTKPAVGERIESQKEMPNRSDSVNRQYHDIFLKLKSPHELVFGHVLNWPEAAEKKVEKRGRNNYKGQVIWADRKGGYGEHYWDLALGAL